MPDWVDDRVFDRAFAGMQQFLEEVGADRHHELRRVYDARLRAYVHALRTDPATAARVEDAQEGPARAPGDPRLVGVAVDQREERLPGRRRRPRLGAARAGGRADPATAPGCCRPTRRCASWCSGRPAGIAGYLVERFSGDLADLVGSTVARWDTEETSRRIELQVGRDLQFIRVNGTVVGGLAGLVIYTVAQLMG